MVKTVAAVTLGCKVNQYDTEAMLEAFERHGYRIVPNGSPADVYLVNTCTVTGTGDKKSLQLIRRCRRRNPQADVVVTGCLAQRMGEQLRETGARLILGTQYRGRVVELLEQAIAENIQMVAVEGIENAPYELLSIRSHEGHTRAVMKIQEGCDNHCTYCIIPKLRGKLRSRPIEELVKEAEQLAADGVKELIVVAQDTSRYGLDLYGERKLAELLRQLCRIDGLVWIRVHYLYPDEMSQELIDVLANEPKIVKYLDIPIQHINDDILRRMNRRGNGEYVKELFAKLRREIPGLVLRTSLITGLPGEGEAEFAQLCDFLKEYKLERVGAFAFSPEEGTRAAEMEYPDTEIARQRADMVAEIQSRIMDDYNESCIGKTMQVLCEGYDPDEESYYGRTFADSPDIDGKIWFTAEKHIKTGDFADVRVVDAYDGELVGVLEEEYNDDCE